MRRHGIHYDTGFAPSPDRLSRPRFDPAQVRRELAIIARDLHCDAVRISGRDPARLVVAAEYALAEGLEVWFSPMPTDLTAAELVPYFATCARAAEPLRRASSRVVFVMGCELTLFAHGFVPGASQDERMRAMQDPARLAAAGVAPEQLVARFDAFQGDAVAAVRAAFAGPVTYASGSWEPVDWRRFDLVGVDHYRDAGNRDAYRAPLDVLAAQGKPVVVTEVGCCTYRGAEDRGATGWAIVDRRVQPPRLTEPVVRDEEVQAAYLRDVLAILDAAPIDGAFWFTFAGYGHPHHADPRRDLDCASYGIVTILDGATGDRYPGLPWQPKRAFDALASAYAR